MNIIIVMICNAFCTVKFTSQTPIQSTNNLVVNQYRKNSGKC